MLDPDWHKNVEEDQMNSSVDHLNNASTVDSSDLPQHYFTPLDLIFIIFSDLTNTSDSSTLTQIIN